MKAPEAGADPSQGVRLARLSRTWKPLLFLRPIARGYSLRRQLVRPHDPDVVAFQTHRKGL